VLTGLSYAAFSSRMIFRIFSWRSSGISFMAAEGGRPGAVCRDENEELLPINVSGRIVPELQACAW
jgi:hypothetical protein